MGWARSPAFAAPGSVVRKDCGRTPCRTLAQRPRPRRRSEPLSCRREQPPPACPFLIDNGKVGYHGPRKRKAKRVTEDRGPSTENGQVRPPVLHQGREREPDVRFGARLAAF